MAQIKVTYVPNDKNQGYKEFLNNVISLNLYNTELSNISILYNSDLDINIEDSDSNVLNYTTYVNLDSLYYIINTLVDENDYSLIIIYGFELSLDDIKENIFNIIRNTNVFMSINILSKDKELISNTSFYLNPNEINDNNWEKIKKDSMQIYEENKSKNENAIGIIVNLASNISESIRGKNSNDIKYINDAIEIDLDDNYTCYTYEDKKNCISVINVKDLYYIEDENSKVSFTKEAIEFIIETLKKFIAE